MKQLTVFEDGDHLVYWHMSSNGRTHRITYGEQRKIFNDSLAACHEYGECVRHSLECAGRLDGSR